MEPAAREGLGGGGRVLEIALHHDVAAEHDLAEGLAVGRHGLHGLGVDHVEGFEHRIAHALPGLLAPRIRPRRARPTPGAIR